MKEKLHFQDRLSEVMFKRNKMKASQLGREVGLSHVTIGNYLVGRPPKSEHLVKIARFFSVSTDWLLGLEGQPADWAVSYTHLTLPTILRV